jgi:uncharacterized protein DUF6268
MCLFLSSFSNSAASVDICRQPPDDSHLSIAYYDHDRSFVDRGNATTNQENLNSDLQFKMSDKLALGIGHQYTILNADLIEPQTNGHLHTIYLPLHLRTQSDRGSIRLSIAPALSASSNVVSEPGSYKSDALQLLAALVWRKQMSDQLTLRYGLCGDHRFGRYTIYPSIGVDWQPHADWTFDLGLPTSQITYQVSKSLTSSLRIAPDGNEWYVRDKSMKNQSRFIYEAFLLEWAFSWQTHEHIVFSASVGRQFHNRYEMTLTDDSRARIRGDAVTRIGTALAWRF